MCCIHNARHTHTHITLKELIVMAVNLDNSFEGEPWKACHTIMNESEKVIVTFVERWMEAVQTQMSSSITAVVDASKHTDVVSALEVARKPIVDQKQLEDLLDKDAVLAFHEVDNHVVV